MPKTLFEKIWNAHLVATRMDGRELIYIDRHVLHELHAPHAFESLEQQGRPVRRPDLTFSMQDHTVSTRPGRTDTSNPDGAPFLRAMREGSRRNGIRVFDLGDPEQGISHVVAPELGMVLPGATHAVPDSHASTVGGLGALAFGCGTSELGHILATQVIAMRRSNGSPAGPMLHKVRNGTARSPTGGRLQAMKAQASTARLSSTAARSS